MLWPYSFRRRLKPPYVWTTRCCSLLPARVDQALAVGVDALPATLPPASQVIVQGGDAMALSAARARYPGAALVIERDLQSNPRLFVLQLP